MFWKEINGNAYGFKLYFIDWRRQKLKKKTQWIGFENFGIRKNNPKNNGLWTVKCSRETNVWNFLQRNKGWDQTISFNQSYYINSIYYV